MKKLIFLLALLPATCSAGTIAIYQNLGGNLGAVIFSSGPTPGVTFDTYVSSQMFAGPNPQVFNITIGSGRRNFVALGCGGISGSTVTAATIGGNAMTLSVSTGTAGRNSRIWTYAGLPAGSAAISATFTGGIAADCIAASFFEVDQSTPVDSTASSINVAAGVQTTLVTNYANDLLFDFILTNNNDAMTTTQSNQTRLTLLVGASINAASSTAITTTPGSYDLGWTPLQTNHNTCSIAIKPGAALP